MSISRLNSVPFIVMVWGADIYRLKSGPDYIMLRTNLPNPVWPYTGTLSIKLATTRGGGRQWIKENLKGDVEITEADLETLPKSGETDAGGASHALLATDGIVASGSRRPTLGLKKPS